MNSRIDPPAVESINLAGLGPASGTDLAAPLPSLQDRAQHFSVRFGPPGDCPKDVDVRHQVIDDLSGSLGGAGAAGNDPAGLRHVAVLKAVEKIGAACKCQHETVQIFSFDLTSEIDVGPVQTNTAGLRKLDDALSSTSVGWGISTLGPSLAAARTSIEDFDGHVTLTILSDFLLTDIPAIVPELAEYPADSIHAVVLTAPTPAALLNQPSITVTEAGWSDDPALVAEAVYAELTRFRPPSKARRRQTRGRRRR